MTNAERIAAIDALIDAKLSGATDVAQLASRALGDLSIDMPSGIDALLRLREHYARCQSFEDFVGREDHFVLEEP